MEQLGILTEVDMAAFAGYCQAYARWKEAEEFISRHGAIVKTPSGYWQQVPQVSIAQQYMKQMSKFCEQFGLTPASRSRIVTDRGNDSSDDAMEQLLSLGRREKVMYDENKAKRAVTFINALKHTKGKWRGVPFELLPWQDKIINDVFGTVKENGYRQYNTAYVEIPKKMVSQNLQQEWRCILHAVTVNGVQKYTAVQVTVSRQVLCLMWRWIWSNNVLL